MIREKIAFTKIGLLEIDLMLYNRLLPLALHYPFLLHVLSNVDRRIAHQFGNSYYL